MIPSILGLLRCAAGCCGEPYFWSIWGFDMEEEGNGREGLYVICCVGRDVFYP